MGNKNIKENQKEVNLNTAEAAKRMNLSKEYVRKLCANGVLLGAYKKHKHGPWNIPENSVEDWIKNSIFSP